ncbi:hypothetical protein Q3G72_018533 [Acer saccharum]|nr:hypothetical protein Q3G72_018533 [Acer saccharum]
MEPAVNEAPMTDTGLSSPWKSHNERPEDFNCSPFSSCWSTFGCREESLRPGSLEEGYGCRACCSKGRSGKLGDGGHQRVEKLCSNNTSSKGICWLIEEVEANRKQLWKRDNLKQFQPQIST